MWAFEGEAVDDGGDQAGVGKYRSHALRGRLLASPILARSSRSVMIWKSSSAPRGSIWM
jgi:hypothetical protein